MLLIILKMVKSPTRKRRKAIINIFLLIFFMVDYPPINIFGSKSRFWCLEKLKIEFINITNIKIVMAMSNKFRKSM